GDAANATILRRVQAHSGEINSIAFSPNGRLVATASDDMTAKTWNVDSGECVAAFAGHHHFVVGICFRDDHRVVSGDAAGVLQVWDSSTGCLLASPRERRARIETVAAHSAARAVAFGCADGTLEIRDADDWSLRCRIVAHRKETLALAFADDGRTILTAGGDGVLRSWDVSSGRLIAENHCSEQSLFGLTIGSRRWAAVAGRDRVVRLVDPHTLETIKSYRGHDGRIWSLAHSRDGRLLFSAGEDSKILAWSPDDSQEGLSVEWRHDGASDLRFSANGRWLAAADSEGGAVVWRADDFTEAWRIAPNGEGKARIAFCAADDQLAYSVGQRNPTIHDAATGRRIGEIANGDRKVYGLEFSPEANELAVASGGVVRLRDFVGGALLASFRGTADNLSTLAFSTCGSTMIGAGDDGFLYWWTLAGNSGKLLRREGHRGAVARIRAPQHGTFLVSAGDDQTVRLWPMDGVQPPKTLRGHQAAVVDVAVTADGRTIASIDVSGVLRFWLGDVGVEAGRFQMQPGRRNRLDFSPDGRSLAVTEDGRRLRILRIGDAPSATTPPTEPPPDFADVRRR
ncbi:MAG: WD40 repeat domain-containing protein, partial [Planctomycetia bacterium]